MFLGYVFTGDGSLRDAYGLPNGKCSGLYSDAERGAFAFLHASHCEGNIPYIDHEVMVFLASLLFFSPKLVANLKCFLSTKQKWVVDLCKRQDCV